MCVGGGGGGSVTPLTFLYLTVRKMQCLSEMRKLVGNGRSRIKAKLLTYRLSVNCSSTDVKIGCRQK